MSVLIDEIDIKILNLLQQNARLNHKELGDKLHKAPTTIYSRISKLEKFGLIKAYVALLSPERIDRKQTVYVRIVLKEHDKNALQQFEELLNSLPEAMEAYQITGDYDFMLRVMTKDMDSYYRFLGDKLFESGFIVKTDSTVIMRESKKITAFALQPDDLKKATGL